MQVEDKFFSFREVIAEDDKYRPRRATGGSAGYDLKAYMPQLGSLPIYPQERVRIRTNYQLLFHKSTCGLILPRSGLVAKYGVTVANSPGLIDADFKNELQIILINHSSETYVVNDGDRIAQLIVIPLVFDIDDEPVSADSRTHGEGFGSTGR